MARPITKAGKRDLSRAKHNEFLEAARAAIAKSDTLPTLVTRESKVSTLRIARENKHGIVLEKVTRKRVVTGMARGADYLNRKRGGSMEMNFYRAGGVAL